jgi:SAM-dependent methyltransferase
VLVLLTLLLNAATIFLLEPFAGKSLTPWYGGSPAVWNACMFFFQAVLLAGYLYAHCLQRFSLPVQLTAHGGLMAAACLTLPVSIVTAGVSGPAVHPSWSVVGDLIQSVGGIFFVLSATSPLLQAWFAQSGTRQNPYPLFAASNLGSLIGLLAFPFVIEPWLPLAAQGRCLTAATAAVVLLVGASGVTCWRRSASVVADSGASAGVQRLAATPSRRLGLWLVLSIFPCMLLMGTTTHLTSEIAPMPLLWIVPLALYLASFVIAFSHDRFSATVTRWAGTAFVVCALVIACRVFLQRHEAVDILLHSLLLAAGATALHGQLAASRPETERLTEYYAVISLGGLLGSGFCVLAAPLLFNWQAEYPLAIAGSLLLVAWPAAPRIFGRDAAWIARIAIAGMVVLGLTWNIYCSKQARRVLLRERTFFGDFQVSLGKAGRTIQLTHGRTTHGAQMISDDPRSRRPPLCYYFFTGPFGRALLSVKGTPASTDVAVVGLGVGALAAYGEKGDHYDFYEIDEAIQRVADGGGPFTFLADARTRGAHVQVILGDARLRLQQAAPASYGMIVLDAFSSDAIPVHLLTVEAVAEYLQALREDGLLVFHISNIFVDLEPVVANLAAALGLTAYVQDDVNIPEEDAKRGRFPSTWVVAARSEKTLAPIVSTGGWQRCQQRQGVRLWTDQFSNVLTVMRQWGNGDRGEAKVGGL